MGVIFMSVSKSGEAQRKPDNIVVFEAGGTTYEVHEFFSGKKTVEEIITQRIIQELASNPLLSESKNPAKA